MWSFFFVVVILGPSLLQIELIRETLLASRASNNANADQRPLAIERQLSDGPDFLNEVKTAGKDNIELDTTDLCSDKRNEPAKSSQV